MTDRDRIHDTLIRYATAIDTRDWDLLHTCFTADAVTDYGDMGTWTDRDGLVEFMVNAHVGFGPSNHLMTNFSIDIDASGDRATASSYVHAVLVFLHDPNQSVDSIGSYRDTLVRDGDDWRISSRTFRLTRTTMTTRPTKPTKPTRQGH